MEAFRRSRAGPIRKFFYTHTIRQKNPAQPEVKRPGTFLPVTSGADKRVRLVRSFRKNAGAVPAGARDIFF